MECLCVCCMPVSYFASQAKGVKSSLCLVLKIMFLVLISRIDGGCRGVAIAKRASWGGAFPPLSCCWFCPCRNLSLPWMFRAWKERQINESPSNVLISERLQNATQPHSSFCRIDMFPWFSQYMSWGFILILYCISMKPMAFSVVQLSAVHPCAP